jgi:hypothetical protein
MTGHARLKPVVREVLPVALRRRLGQWICALDLPDLSFRKATQRRMQKPCRRRS